MTKQYDRAYFDRWYRDQGFGSRASLDRKVHYALGATEYVIGRRVRTVLDVGCGEGAWQPVLRRLRPAVRYVGVDPSAYAIERFGVRRNLRPGEIGELDALDLPGPFDLIVCVDVLAYVSNHDARRGLATMGRLLEGVALIEVFTSADDFEGDLAGYHRRAPAVYERWLAASQLRRIGPNLFVGAARFESLSHFERGC